MAPVQEIRWIPSRKLGGSGRWKFCIRNREALDVSGVYQKLLAIEANQTDILAAVRSSPISEKPRHLALPDKTEKLEPVVPSLNDKLIALKAKLSVLLDISNKRLDGKSRSKEIVRSRQIVMYLLRKILVLSYKDIGQKVGGRDHTTVLHACKKVEAQIEKDPDFKRLIKGLEAGLLE